MKNYCTDFWRRALVCASLSVLLLSGTASGQCLSDQFNIAGFWTNGTGGNCPTIAAGVSNWAAIPGAAWNYMHRPLGFTLNSWDAWTAEIAFNPTAGSCPAHTLMSLTDATTNSWNSGPPGFPASVLDAVEVYIAETNCGAAPWPLFANAKDNVAGWGTPSTAIMIAPNNMYYIRLQRFSATQGMLSVFSDASFTQHIAGSPQCFTINQNVTGLAFVQQGCIPQGGNFRSLTATFDNLNICHNYSMEGYSSSTGWAQYGTGIWVASNVAQYSSCAAGADNRMAKNVMATLGTSQQWVVEADFTPTGVGSFGAGNGIICLSSSSAANIWNNSVSMDAVAVYLASTGGVHNLYAAAKDGTTWSMNSTAIPLTLGSTYYLRVSRCGTSGLLSVFSNSGQTTHVAGSPQAFTIPTTVEGLTVLGHCGMQSWSGSRALSGSVDHTEINNYAIEAGAIGSNQQICYGAIPQLLTNIQSGSTCGGATYQWESETPCGSSQWQSIVGATSATYQPPALTQNTCYRRRINYNCGSSSVLTNTVTITVDPELIANAGSDQVVCCRHYPPPPVVNCYLGGSASGGTPPYTYAWTCSPNFLVGPNTQNPWFVICNYYNVPMYQPTFTLTVTDAHGCQTVDYVTVSIQTCADARMAETTGSIDQATSMVITPNPTAGFFTLQFADNATRNIEVTDALGRIVYSQAEFADLSLQVDFADLPKGIYIVRCTEGDRTYYERLILQ